MRLIMLSQATLKQKSSIMSTFFIFNKQINRHKKHVAVLLCPSAEMNKMRTLSTRHQLRSSYIHEGYFLIKRYFYGRKEFKKSTLSEQNLQLTYKPWGGYKIIYEDTPNTLLSDNNRELETNPVFISNIDNILENSNEYLPGVAERAKKYKARTIIKNFITEYQNSKIAKSQWENLSQELIAFNTGSWDIFCMSVFYSMKNLEMAEQLMNYLENKGNSMNRILLSIYAKILGKCSNGNETIENKAKLYFDRILSENETIDPPTAHNLMLAIIYTRHYKEANRVIKIAKKLFRNERKHLDIYLFQGSVFNNDQQLFKSLLNMPDIKFYIEDGKFNQHYIELLEEFLNGKNTNMFSQMSDVIRSIPYFSFPKNDLDMITNVFEKVQPGKWKCTRSYVYQKWQTCANCNLMMETVNVTNAEFLELREKFLEQVIIKNLSYTTSLYEVHTFLTFLEIWGSFDIVIDGLNCMYKNGTFGLLSVLKIIEHYTDKGCKVLLIGNISFSKYEKRMKEFFSRKKRRYKNYILYTVSSSKVDDLFLIHAALHSSKYCQVVTFDKMRDHGDHLEPRLRFIFQRWMKTVHVMRAKFDHAGTFIPEEVCNINFGPRQDPGGWHFPLFDSTKNDPFGKNSVICVRENFKEARKPLEERYKPYKGKKTEIFDKVTPKMKLFLFQLAESIVTTDIPQRNIPLKNLADSTSSAVIDTSSQVPDTSSPTEAVTSSTLNTQGQQIKNQKQKQRLESLFEPMEENIKSELNSFRSKLLAAQITEALKMKKKRKQETEKTDAESK